MDDMDAMDINITAIMQELDTVAVGVGAKIALDRVNETVYQLRVRKLLWQSYFLSCLR